MVVGAVAEVLEHMRPFRERRLADPVRPFAAHLGEAFGRAVHPLHHVMAADAGIGAHALRHLCRGVMRAAGAEIGRADAEILGARERGLRLLRACAPAVRDRSLGAKRKSRRPIAMAMSLASSAPVTGNSQRPVFVLLADADRLVRRAVKLLAHLHLDQRALFLDDDDQSQARARSRADPRARAARGRRA